MSNVTGAGFDIGAELEALHTDSGNGDAAGLPALRAVGVEEFLSMPMPHRESLLSPWLREGEISMLYGPRGVGKTYLAMGIAVAVSSGGAFLNWQAPGPKGVLYVDGEMPAQALKERLSRNILTSDKEPIAPLPLQIITPDLQERSMPDISTLQGQVLVEPHLDGVSLVIIDNISTLCRTGRENEAESWLPIQAWALSLRGRGISVLFVHHAGKAGYQRGTSRREDTLDCILALRRPGDYTPEDGAHFVINFEKARALHGDDVRGIDVRLSAEGKWIAANVEDTLTEKVAAYLADGFSQKEIADVLRVSKGTVSKHKQKAIAFGIYKGGN